VEISAALSTDLKALTDLLDEPGTDLEATLQALAADTRQAVDSYLGLTMTLVIDGYPITLTTVEPVEVETSLRLPLSALGNAGLLGALVFYAGNPGAFVDLAADLSFALGLGPDVVALDQDLTPISDPAGLTGLTGLAEMSQVNQAIGILIERGHMPDSARTELHRLANLAQTTPHAAAHQLIHTARAHLASELT
jgi:hypothetical protein